MTEIQPISGIKPLAPLFSSPSELTILTVSPVAMFPAKTVEKDI
jgi:hypothetical protein